MLRFANVPRVLNFGFRDLVLKRYFAGSEKAVRFDREGRVPFGWAVCNQIIEGFPGFFKGNLLRGYYVRIHDKASGITFPPSPGAESFSTRVARSCGVNHGSSSTRSRHGASHRPPASSPCFEHIDQAPIQHRYAVYLNIDRPNDLLVSQGIPWQERTGARHLFKYETFVPDHDQCRYEDPTFSHRRAQVHAVTRGTSRSQNAVSTVAPTEPSNRTRTLWIADLINSHLQWAKAEGDVVTVGITDHAQAELGDVVYVELPEVGSTVTHKATFGVVESVKVRIPTRVFSVGLVSYKSSINFPNRMHDTPLMATRKR